MASFYFRAVTPDGKLRTGTLTGETDKAVARELRTQGLIPVYVGLQPKKSFALKLPEFNRGRRRDVLFFTQELSTLLNSGVPLDRALSITSELTERANFRFVVLDILRVLKGGRSLADSLATHPEYFSSLYVNIVRAGEASGALGTVFERLSEFERTRDDLRNYIISSMIYPGLLTLVGLGSILVLLNFVVPRFAQVFQESRLTMPLPTQIMLEASRIMKTYGWIAVAAVIAAISGLRLYIRTAAGRMWWDSFRLRIPILGEALRKAETSRFARAMATLVSNSVPLVQSLGIAAAILNNRKIAASLESVAQGVKRGEGLAAPLKRTGQFPPLAAHLLSVGEETGRLDQMFARMADIYEADTRAAIKRFTALFEPMVILVMGIMVGVLILSMMLAITSINEVAV
ncbi:MAG TPA: type II secretion system F family protein [Bryobacteraceae bacterium]|nr:type II secretion system F family protein [Bryobacteraceae bacterium]HOQ47088.1 type II secretion system F family protein [Bryobacteraceae bacterium]HPQ13752.1 type II secretion system F family protein [Bryobacteraceae bacterium]HPU71039.1 type II secretion system F family protein [Bryobacteraceae bacterium]